MPRTAPGASGRAWQLHCTRPTAVLLPRTALYRTHAHSPREPCGAEEKQLLLQRNMALRELAPRCRSSSGTAVAHISPALASERYTDESGVRRSLKIVASPQDHRGTTKDHIAPTYRPDVRTVALAEPEHELIAVRADERRSASVRRRLCACGRRRAFRRPVTHRAPECQTGGALPLQNMFELRRKRCTVPGTVVQRQKRGCRAARPRSFLGTGRAHNASTLGSDNNRRLATRPIQYGLC